MSKESQWAAVKIVMGGKEIDVKPVVFNKEEKCQYPEMEYYMRRGNKYFFRSKIGGGNMAIVSDDELFRVLKYGQVVGLNFSENEQHS